MHLFSPSAVHYSRLFLRCAPSSSIFKISFGFLHILTEKINLLTFSSYSHHIFITFLFYNEFVRRKRTLIILFHNFFLRTANLPICSPILFYEKELAQTKDSLLRILVHATGCLFINFYMRQSFSFDVRSLAIALAREALDI